MTGVEWFCLSDGCSRTFVFFRLTVSPNLLDAFANQSKSYYAESWVCATNAQSSANSKSPITEEKILVWVCNSCKFEILPSIRNWIRTPMSQSLKATKSIIEKKILKSSWAKNQPCLVPWVMQIFHHCQEHSQACRHDKNGWCWWISGDSQSLEVSRGLPNELNRRFWWDLWWPYRDSGIVPSTSYIIASLKYRPCHLWCKLFKSMPQWFPHLVGAQLCRLSQGLLLLLLLNVFVNTPYVDVGRSNCGSGWHSLVVTQTSSSHQLLCVQVYMCACNCFVWYLL